MLSRDESRAIYDAGPEGLVALVEQLWAPQAALEQQVTGLTARATELETRLNTDSHHRHNPPTSAPLRVVGAGVPGALLELARLVGRGPRAPVAGVDWSARSPAATLDSDKV